MENRTLRCLRIVTALVQLLIFTAVLLPPSVAAKIVRIDITSREVASDVPEHGRSGAYEVIKGRIYLEVNPENPANQLIADLKLADRNRHGNVEFSTDFELHKPVTAIRGNHRLLYFVNNRGNRMGTEHFNHQAGKNWLYSGGWSYLWCGWNCDVIEGERRLNITVPVATENGKPITGRIYTEICSWANDLVYSMPFVWGGSIAYPAATMDNAHATLTVRPYRWEDPVEVPRDQWAFARLENGEIVPDPRYLYLKEGIKPGWLYDLDYIGKDPKVTGLGLAAIRDVVSFFKYEQADEEGVANPLAGVIDYAYAWGHSQSARVLNHFVYQDFNGDESGRMVLDGVMANCPGSGKGLFNSRFAQTTRHGSHLEDNLYPIDFFPFTTVEQYDPIKDEHGDGLSRARASGFLPKMMFINSSTDYWTRAASLLHTDVEGKRDAEIDPNVRIYLVAGRAHVDARIGIIGRALLTALDQWVTYGVDPPESQVPKISDGTLVNLAAVRQVFPNIPGAALPESFYHPYRLDMGPRWHTEGIADNAPPKAGPRYVCLVPQIDQDGNELAGIRLPEIAVPVATFTGWTLRSPSFSRTLGRNTGTVWPFPGSAVEREKTGDPRPSIAERYPSGTDFLAKATRHLFELRRQRFLLDEDLGFLLKQAVGLSNVIGDLRSVEEVAIEDGAEAGATYARQLIDADILSWFGSSFGRLAGDINSKGYGLMSAGRPEAALEVFKLNTLLFPDDWNAWDSLAEWYYNAGEYDVSLDYYEKSVGMNPENEYGKLMITRIKGQAGRE